MGSSCYREWWISRTLSLRTVIKKLSIFVLLPPVRLFVCPSLIWFRVLEPRSSTCQAELHPNFGFSFLKMSGRLSTHAALRNHVATDKYELPRHSTTWVQVCLQQWVLYLLVFLFSSAQQLLPFHWRRNSFSRIFFSEPPFTEWERDNQEVVPFPGILWPYYT